MQPAETTPPDAAAGEQPSDSPVRRSRSRQQPGENGTRNRQQGQQPGQSPDRWHWLRAELAGDKSRMMVSRHAQRIVRADALSLRKRWRTLATRHRASSSPRTMLSSPATSRHRISRRASRHRTPDVAPAVANGSCSGWRVCRRTTRKRRVTNVVDTSDSTVMFQTPDSKNKQRDIGKPPLRSGCLVR